MKTKEEGKTNRNNKGQNHGTVAVTVLKWQGKKKRDSSILITVSRPLIVRPLEERHSNQNNVKNRSRRTYGCAQICSFNLPPTTQRWTYSADVLAYAAVTPTKTNKNTCIDIIYIRSGRNKKTNCKHEFLMSGTILISSVIKETRKKAKD